MMEMDDHLQAMSIEEHRMATEPIEKLEEVFLNDFKLDRTTKIGTLANPAVRQALTTFLRNNRDIFAWRNNGVVQLLSEPISCMLSESTSGES